MFYFELMELNRKILITTSMVFVAAFSRLLPHPPNFTPMISIALFSGAVIVSRPMALIIPLLAMFASDIFLGFHSLQPVVYASILLISVSGMFINEHHRFLKVTGYSVSGSLFFFFITNSAVWMFSGMYSPGISGLLSSLVMGLPFLTNTLLSSLLYSAVLFGSFHFLENRKVFQVSAASR